MNAIHRTSERMAASLTNRTLAQAAPNAIPQPLLVSSFTNSAPEFNSSGVATIL